MIPTDIRLVLLPEVVNAHFHLRRSRDQQSIALLDFPIRILCVLIMKDYDSIHNSGMELSPFISKVLVHQLDVSLDTRENFLKEQVDQVCAIINRNFFSCLVAGHVRRSPVNRLLAAEDVPINLLRCLIPPLESERPRFGDLFGWYLKE
jgi:hypothetical protein